MRSSLECVPCLVRQTMESVRHTIDDEDKKEKLMRRFLRDLSRMDFSRPPPVVAQKVHRELRRASGVDDPYRDAKDRFTAMALEILPSLKERIAAGVDPFGTALRLAIAGNVIDLGVNGDLTEADALGAMRTALEEPVAGNIKEFQDAVHSARNILFLADNAGEIVFDRPLIRALPPGRVTVVVRGAPVINDAVARDAVAAGIPEIARLIDNGSDAPGTILADCSNEFRREFESADVIISKGQGNYETLCDEEAPLFFLFKVKCPTVARHCGLAIGTHALIRGSRRP
jgi:uncharacterized protein with ATP-grasp and redox domains